MSDAPREIDIDNVQSLMLSHMLEHSMSTNKKLQGLLERMGEDHPLVWHNIVVTGMQEFVEYRYKTELFEEAALVLAGLLVEAARRSFIERDPEFAMELLNLSQESKVYFKRIDNEEPGRTEDGD